MYKLVSFNSKREKKETSYSDLEMKTYHLIQKTEHYQIQT